MDFKQFLYDDEYDDTLDQEQTNLKGEINYD